MATWKQIATKEYVDSLNIDDNLNISGDSGTGQIDLDTETLDFEGDVNSIETTINSNKVQLGLRNIVSTNHIIATQKLESPVLDSASNLTLIIGGTSQLKLFKRGEPVNSQIGHIDSSGNLELDGGITLGTPIADSNIASAVTWNTVTSKVDANGDSMTGHLRFYNNKLLKFGTVGDTTTIGSDGIHLTLTAASNLVGNATQHINLTANDSIYFNADTGIFVNADGGMCRLTNNSEVDEIFTPAHADDITTKAYVDTASETAKYYYESKVVNFSGTDTSVYLPMGGSLNESTTQTGKMEDLGLLAPYNGTIQKIIFKSSYAQSGSFRISMFEGDDGDGTADTEKLRRDSSILLNIEASHEEILHDTNNLTAPYNSPNLTKGKMYSLYATFPDEPRDCKVIIVFKWDITT